MEFISSNKFHFVLKNYLKLVINCDKIHYIINKGKEYGEFKRELE